MFLCLFVAYVVCPVRDFICPVLHMSGVGPSALRRREFVRHVATSQPCLALARASLWLLLPEVFSQKRGCLHCFPVFVVSGKCALVGICENRSRVCVILSSCCCLVTFVVENPEAATSSHFSDFLLRLCKAGHVLQPRGGEH